MVMVKRAPSEKVVGEHHHCAKLTEAKVRELRRLVHDVGICSVCAGKIVCPEISSATVYDAVNFYTWKHVR